MKMPRLFFLLGFLAPSLGIPANASAQEECTWCYQCQSPNEDYMYTDDNAPGGYFILYPLGGLHCQSHEGGDCAELIECRDTEDEEEQQAELLAFIDEGNALSLKEFIEEEGDHWERVPDRNLLLFRGGCWKEILGVFQLDQELFAQIE